MLNLIDDARCFETVRAMRRPQGVTCPHCQSPQITKQGHESGEIRCPAAHNAVGLAGESPAVGIDCLSTVVIFDAD